jgi:hypothetical protein
MAMTDDIKTVIKALKANNFKVEYLEKSADAVDMILGMIPIDATIEMAGSVSVGQLGLIDRLRARGNKGLDFPNPSDREAFEAMMKLRRDILLVSSNAVTLDGKLINTDGMGNRVSGMFFGVKKVILLIGQNKIVRNVDEGLERVQKIISPYHATCLGLNTPCSKTGKCEDCNSPQRICNITTIITKKPPSVEFNIILVGEDLGLGWDPDWPEERKEKIAAAYRVEIEKFKATLPPRPNSQ